MRKMVAHVEEHAGVTYELALSFDDGGLVDGAVRFSVEAAR